MLRPINGQPPLEQEATVRECMAEAVLALAGCARGRDVLWDAGAPEALRKGWVAGWGGWVGSRDGGGGGELPCARLEAAAVSGPGPPSAHPKGPLPPWS